MGITAYDVVLTLFLLFSLFFFFVVVTLPSQYDPYHPEFITEENFTEDDKKDDSKSGYGYFSKNFDGERRLKVDVSVQVVVLGDVGRSPRMQYHALSIAGLGGRVDLVGHVESEVHPDIRANRLINIVPIAPLPERLRTDSKLLYILVAPLKVLWQSWALYHALGYRSGPSKWMLVQTPPAIPTLAIAAFLCSVRNTRLAIDWHNFGSSLLALRLSPWHPLVKIAQLYERFFARSAKTHFCVTDAMARVLKRQYGVEAKSLHDRPAAHLQPLDESERKEVLRRLPETAQYADELDKKAWRLIVSPTSWTPDENFDLLLDALVSYSAACSVTLAKQLPKILAIITGKGPQKQMYLDKIGALNQQKKLQNVVVTTAWLSTADYAALLGAADLGVSLHTSSSGVDLPMKVVDMFGAGLPMVGWSKFEAWPELVKEGVNGRGFGSADELSALLERLFGGDGELARMREGARSECGRRWDEEWAPVAGKVLRLVK
ncbi:mannosyltransferase [Elasticomyces elasticus]|nr:mannosyltransferase [Elasticomyces elasticus]